MNMMVQPNRLNGGIAAGAETIDIAFNADGTVTATGGRAVTVERADPGTRWNAVGAIETIAAGQPRPTYDPKSHAYQGWLWEPATVQMLLQSEAFNSGSWIQQGTGRTGASPCTITENTATGIHGIVQNVLLEENQTYVAWVVAQAGSCDTFRFRQTNLNLTCNFNLTTGVATPGSGLAGGMVDLGGGLWLCWCRFTVTTAGSYAIGWRMMSGGSESYTGTSRTLIFWRANIGMSAGPPQSYLAATTSIVSRGDEYIAVAGIPWATVTGQVQDGETGAWLDLGPAEPVDGNVYRLGKGRRPTFKIARARLRRANPQAEVGGSDGIVVPPGMVPLFQFDGTRPWTEYSLIVNGNSVQQVGTSLRAYLDQPNSQSDPMRTEVVPVNMSGEWFTNAGKAMKYLTTYGVEFELTLGAEYAIADNDGGDVLHQLHDVPDPGENSKNPAVALVAYGGYGDGKNHWVINIRGDSKALTPGSGSRYDRNVAVDLGDLTPDIGRPVKWAFKVKLDFAATTPTGLLTVWKDGVQVYAETGTQIGFNDIAGLMIKFGIYKPSWSGPHTFPGLSSRTAWYRNILIGGYP